MTATPHAWEAPGLLPFSGSARVKRYRRLQSWYRAVQLGAEAGRFMTYDPLGSYLHKDEVARQQDLNFLHPAAFEHAQLRAKEVQIEGGSLDPKRLFHNMLSSMPMCFNLFGAVRGEPDFLRVFQSLFDPTATAITEIVCEWAPGQPEARIGDRTAFDAVVFYESDGRPRFIGIETKYTEPFSQKEYGRPEYDAVTRESGWFDNPELALTTLKGAKSNQLWRNLMLAAKLDQHGSRGRGAVAVVALNDDSTADKAISIVKPMLRADHADRLLTVPIEDILDVTDTVAPSLNWWTTSFRRRYIEHALPDDPNATRDPLGPKAGRTLAETASAARNAGVGD